MYERHFGFAEKPFNLTPDSRFLFLSPRHQEAFANLEFGVRERSGFLLLTGEVGTGKTTLIRHYLSQVGADVRTAVILYPALSAGELFHAILQDLEIPFHGGTLKDAVDTLSNALIAAKAKDLKVVVLIDEAQNLQPRVLEQLRLLSNLETERAKLLTLVLVGQPELRDLLDQPGLRQLSQRITSRSHLEPLSLDDTRRYVKHRLVVAGGSGAEIQDAAIRRVHELSGGVPRVVNVICDRALVGAFGHGVKEVDQALIEAAAAEVLSPNQTRGSWFSAKRAEAIALFLLGLAIMLPVGYCVSRPRVSVPANESAALAPRPSIRPQTTPGPREAVVAPAPQPASRTVASPAGSGTTTSIRLTVPGVTGTSPSTPSPIPEPRASAAASPPSVAPSRKTEESIRCSSAQASRTAAIAAIEAFLKTPGFDTARATLTLDQWRAVRLPAIARVQGHGVVCEVAFVPAGSASVAVSDETGTYTLPFDIIKDAYQGSAILCFVDRDGVAARTESGRLAWARKTLERHGLVSIGAGDATVSAALARLGSRVGLKAVTSVEGALLAALYSLDVGAPKGTP